MNKKYMLLAVACMVSQGIMAQISLDIKVGDHAQTILLQENQEELCVFENARVAVCSKNETADSVSLEIAVDKDGTITADEISVGFEHEVSVCGIEVSATKK